NLEMSDETLKKMERDYLMEVIFNNLKKSTSHKIFIYNLDFLRNLILCDEKFMSKFLQNDWISIFEKYLKIPPISKKDDLVLEKILGLFLDIIKSGRLN